jgi:small subunit ribosomal protein S14
MAKKSMINREKKREKTVQKFAAKRAVLKAQIRDLNLSDDERWAAQVKSNTAS